MHIIKSAYWCTCKLRKRLCLLTRVWLLLLECNSFVSCYGYRNAIRLLLYVYETIAWLTKSYMDLILPVETVSKSERVGVILSLNCFNN